MAHRGESAENYLETILRLSKKLPAVRSIDLVHDTGYSKPSISVAMKNLREKELITMDDEGYIKLTESGKEIAQSIWEKHKVITNTLVALGVSEEIAAEDACKIEHVISEETFGALKRYMNDFVDNDNENN